MSDKMISIISRKKFLFRRPGASAVSVPPSQSVVLSEQSNKAPVGLWPQHNPIYFTTQPAETGSDGVAPTNPWGPPQLAPEWIKEDRTWQLATSEDSVREVSFSPQVANSTDVMVEAAAKQAEAGMRKAEEPTPESEPLEEHLEKLTKGELIEWAQRELTLELKPSMTKSDMLQAIYDYREAHA